MDQFNPSMQRLVALGNNYIQAFQGNGTSISERCVKAESEMEGVLAGNKGKKLNFGFLTVKNQPQ